MSVFRKYEHGFFTATILDWKHLLQPDRYKDIILSSLNFLSASGRVQVNAFVIMINHLHLIWHINHPYLLSDVQRDFLKYTAQQIKFDLRENHPDILPQFKVEHKDRQYQFWQRNPLSIPLFSEAVVRQKLKYIHDNPVRAGLVTEAADYFYSSARFYEDGENDFGFLKSIW